MADTASARGKLRRVALADITPHPSDRPRRPDSLTWNVANQMTVAVSAALIPFDVSDIVGIVDDEGAARFMEAPAVRPIEGPVGHEYKFGGIYGERRLWRARLEGFSFVYVKVCDVDAETAQRMHYQENVRQDLPPLADALELARFTGTPVEIAVATGRTEQHVRGRLLLLKAIEPVRHLLAEGKATIEAVHLFARHAVPDQERVWAKVSKLSLDVLQAHHVRGMFGDLHLVLADAPWPLDASIGPRPCVGCPTRSDAQALLFEDATAGAECLDSDCATAKRKAWSAYVLQRAIERGAKVLSREASAKILPPRSSKPVDTHVDLDAPSPIIDGAGKALTWRLVLPESIVPTVAEDGDGNAREVLTVEEATRGARERLLDERAEAQESKAFDPSISLGQIKALDGWAAAMAASRPEIREPTPTPLPKAKAKGSAGERSKAEATKGAEEQAKVVRAVAEKAEGDNDDAVRLAAWAVRVVSDDATAIVVEALDLANELDMHGAPRTVMLASIETTPSEERCRGFAHALLAAELLVRGGEGAELPRRWAGQSTPTSPVEKGEPKPKGRPPCRVCERPRTDHGGEDDGIHENGVEICDGYEPSELACTCGKLPGQRGPHKAGCARRRAKGEPAPAATPGSPPEENDAPEKCTVCGERATMGLPDPEDGMRYFCDRHRQDAKPSTEPTDDERWEAQVVALCVERPRTSKAVRDALPALPLGTIERLLDAKRLKLAPGGKLAVMAGG